MTHPASADAEVQYVQRRETCTERHIFLQHFLFLAIAWKLQSVLGTSVFILHDKLVPRLWQNACWFGTWGLQSFHGAVLEHMRLAIALVYNTYYMTAYIFNDKCAIFLIFIALMCASGFNNWCCRIVTSQNYPAKLLCFQALVVQVVNHKTWVVINLAPVPCSLEMPTCNNNKKIDAGKISSLKLSSSRLHTLCGETGDHRSPTARPVGGWPEALALLHQHGENRHCVCPWQLCRE